MAGRPKGVSNSTKIPNTKKKENGTEEIKTICCIECGCKNQSNFYVSKDKHKKFFGKIPYCKDCIGNIYKAYLTKYNDMNLAIYYMCRKIDSPYIHSAYLGAVDNINNPKSALKGEDSIAKAYMKNLGFSESNNWGYTFDDSQGEDLISGLSAYDMYTKVKKDRKIIGDNTNEDLYDIVEYDTEFLQNKWGIFDNDDLAILESSYMDFEDKLGGQIDEVSLEIIVKQICLQSLEIHKDRTSGNDVSKKVPVLLTLMNYGGLIEKQKNVTTSRSVGQRIEDIERMRPVKDVDPELADVDNLNSLLSAFVGCMARALNKSNDYTTKFEEDYAEYSIDIIENARKESSSIVEQDIVSELMGNE